LSVITCIHAMILILLHLYLVWQSNPNDRPKFEITAQWENTVHNFRNVWGWILDQTLFAARSLIPVILQNRFSPKLMSLWGMFEHWNIVFVIVYYHKIKSSSTGMLYRLFLRVDSTVFNKRNSSVKYNQPYCYIKLYLKYLFLMNTRVPLFRHNFWEVFCHMFF
jgi:hypothetical protein